MATVNKDFRIKNGLIVEGTTATVNGYDILTKKPADQTYIIGLIGGSATPDATPDTVVLRDANANFSANEITADIIGTVSDISNHTTADLTEDPNGPLYFTNQRAIDANTGLWDTIGAAADAEADAILASQQYTDAEISDEVIARDAAILLAKNDAIADAASDATTKANAALADAEDYTDSAISTEVTNRNNAIATAKSEAISSSNGYTDDEITALEGRSESYADAAAQTAEDNAKAYADGLSSGLNWKSAVNVLATSNVALTGSTPLSIDNHTVSNGYRVLLKGQSADAENGIYEMSISGGSYTLSRPADSDAAAEIIGAAVFVMEGDNYASTAWVQSNHYLTTFAGQDWTQFSGQGTYLAGNGIALDGTTFSIDTAVTATKVYADDAADAAETAANSYTDGRETAITTAYEGYADQAESDAVATANAHTDAREIAITSAYEGYAAGVALTAEQNANIYTDGKITDEISDRNNAINNAINSLTTSDIEEGTNLYFEDSRAKTSAADLLTGPGTTLNNITITGTGAGLTITAENGVADSTTADLAEDPAATSTSGTMYFTDSRALGAISGANIQPETIDITWVRREEATWTDINTASKVTCHSAGTGEGSMKYLVRVTAQVGGVRHSHVTEVLATVDGGNNVAVVEYGTIYTSENPLATVTVEWNAGTSAYDLNVTTANNNSEVMVAATMLASLD
jgi:hypothetical protein